MPDMGRAARLVTSGRAGKKKKRFQADQELGFKTRGRSKRTKKDIHRRGAEDAEKRYLLICRETATNKRISVRNGLRNSGRNTVGQAGGEASCLTKPMLWALGKA